MTDYKKSIDKDTLQKAQDWYINQLKLSMGIPVKGGWDAVTNPDGSRDNYMGLKPKTETLGVDVVGPNETPTQQMRDRNYDTYAEYLADPAAWEKKMRDSIQGWTVGHEGNQQYDFDPSGKFTQQWTHDQGDSGLLKFWATVAATAAGANALGGAGPGAANPMSVDPATAAQMGGAASSAAPAASNAWTIKDLTNAVNIAKNPVGAATGAVLSQLPSGSKDYLDLLAAVTGKRPEAAVTNAVNDAVKGSTGTTKTDSTKADSTADKTKSSNKDNAYGIPLGLLAMLGAQNQPQTPRDPTLYLDPGVLKFDPFGTRS